MDIAVLKRELEAFVQNSELNRIQAEDAVSPECAVRGLSLFERSSAFV